MHRYPNPMAGADKPGWHDCGIRVALTLLAVVVAGVLAVFS